MEDLKIFETLTKYYQIIEEVTDQERDFTDEERYFVRNLEVELAKSIVHDFHNTGSKKIAKIILDILD